jgi:hypothetical protein
MAQDSLPRIPDELFTDQSMHAAVARYRETLRDALELSHMNAYIRLDPATGDYALGKTRGDARRAFKEQFGDRVAWTMHIGTV